MKYASDELLDWLLEPNNPSVRYWTLKDLKDYDEKNSEVKSARQLIMKSQIVQSILDKQAPEGHWANREDMYLPKYKATTHQLLILAELGANLTPKIEKSIEHIFEFQRSSGHFLTKLPKTKKGKNSIVKDACCLDGNILYYMVHFGYLFDSRVQRLIHFIIDYHDDENAGWKCRAYPINPDAVFPKNCYMGSIKVLKALSVIPKHERSSEIQQLILREVGNLMENNIYQYLRNPDDTRKDKAGWKRFGFPLFYQTDVLEILDILTRLRFKDPRMIPALEVLLGSRQKDGRWLLKNSFNGKMWVDIEKKHKPSKWITLKALRILKQHYN